MRLVAFIRCRIVPLLSAAAIALPVCAASNLLENSPFLPPNSSGAAAREAAPLELRSVIRAGGDYEFSLYDTAKRQSTWARLNESGHDFVIKAYDADHETVTVEQQNRTYKLTLKEARIVPLNIVPVANQPPAIATLPQTAAPGGPRGQTGGTMAVADRSQGQPGSSPTLTPEQLRNLEADINRRRELRRQAAASLAQPQAQSASPQPQRR
jgi:hypothetical protein